MQLYVDLTWEVLLKICLTGLHLNHFVHWHILPHSLKTTAVWKDTLLNKFIILTNIHPDQLLDRSDSLNDFLNHGYPLATIRAMWIQTWQIIKKTLWKTPNCNSLAGNKQPPNLRVLQKAAFISLSSYMQAIGWPCLCFRLWFWVMCLLFHWSTLEEQPPSWALTRVAEDKRKTNKPH